jgi:7-cyano-7-deazaguanine synthase in queuosine biosynthesis
MSNRQNDFNKYRNSYDSFIYNKYSYRIEGKQLRISFDFILSSRNQEQTPSVHFNPQLKLALPAEQNKTFQSTASIENLIFHMGMVELISYWKAACPRLLIVRPFKLNENQIQFWKKLYWNGLGEFFYRNEIETSIQDFMQIKPESDESLQSFSIPAKEKIIVPVGGGKDSVVSLEILKASGHRLHPFIINPRGASRASVEKAGLDQNDLLLAERSIDSNLLRLNQEGFLNGHTPFSAMLAFTTLLQAFLIGAKYIALSNESSANEVSVANSHVNHQYSKSFEFEQDFREYVKLYISPSIHYFSFLRPLSELQIACLFSKFEKHHFSFRSCNVGSKTDSWCGNCPKCLFTYIMLAPFLPEEKLNKMLGGNLILKESLSTTLEELRGLTKEKPFECVGTVEEVNLALNQALYSNHYPLPTSDKSKISAFDNLLFTKNLKNWNSEHFLPSFLEQLLKQKLEEC